MHNFFFQKKKIFYFRKDHVKFIIHYPVKTIKHTHTVYKHIHHGHGGGGGGGGGHSHGGTKKEWDWD